MISEHADLRFATKAIHVGQEPDPSTGATVPPIHPTTTYTQTLPGQNKGYEYSRSGNPTRKGLERCLASLEGGSRCAAFASGSAASAAVFGTLAPGDRVLAYADVYGGTFRMLKRVFEGYGIVPVFTERTDPAAFAELIDERTKLVWLESPTNPLLRCLDIAAIAKITHAAGALLAVDNTFATPALQRPIALGADYVVHSTTKYIGGHSDVIGGAVIVKAEQLIERIAFLQNALGGVPGPFDCYLQHRGIKTLDVRMQRHSENAERIAQHLQGHPKLDKVIYPGLPDHPDHALARRQMTRFGGMVTIVFADGDAAFRFCGSVRIFALAESLGGVESLVNHPAVMTHASIPKEVREARGVTDGVVRLSVGIEAIDDLIADVDQALAAV
jgi:cystathionine beta-lyase/cystathionine gamma-synthase